MDAGAAADADLHSHLPGGKSPVSETAVPKRRMYRRHFLDLRHGSRWRGGFPGRPRYNFFLILIAVLVIII